MAETNNQNTQLATINGSVALAAYASFFAPLYTQIKSEVLQQLKTGPELWNDPELLTSALRYSDLQSLPQETARVALPDILDASKVPHGDLAVPSKIVHSGRHVISQWQRQAAGAITIVLGHDKDGDLCIALGPQRGFMSSPQGYMESRLPKENLSTIPEGSSRLNRTTGEFVAAEKLMAECAIREVYEELGIKISEEQLKLIDITNHNPILSTVEVNYGLLLDNTPKLQTIDEEFKDDDMSKPQWFKVKDIKPMAGKCYPDGVKLPMKQCDIPTIQKAIKTLSGISDKDRAACTDFLAFNAKAQEQSRSM